jgi:hypothetical protein
LLSACARPRKAASRPRHRRSRTDTADR